MSIMNLHRSRPILLLAMIGIFSGCTRQRAGDDEEESAAPQPLVQVHAGRVRRGDIPVTATVTGKTDVLRKEKILAPAAGKIVSLPVLEFQAVREGDVLAIIRTKESQAAIDGARALLQSAATPKQRADAQKALDLASGLQSAAVVRATMGGIISSRSVTEGEMVSENAELLTIIDPATICFVGDVPLRNLQQMQTGQPCTVRFPTIPGMTVQGRVEAFSPQSDLRSQTVGMRVRFVDLSPVARRVLRPDIAGTAVVTTGVHRNVLLVPVSALILNDETNVASVVVITKDSIALSVPVQTVERTDSTLEIRGAGLQEGMEVVTEGNYAIPDSARVTIVGRNE